MQMFEKIAGDDRIEIPLLRDQLLVDVDRACMLPGQSTQKTSLT